MTDKTALTDAQIRAIAEGATVDWPYAGIPQFADSEIKTFRGRPWVPLELAEAKLKWWQERDWQHGWSLAARALQWAKEQHKCADEYAARVTALEAEHARLLDRLAKAEARVVEALAILENPKFDFDTKVECASAAFATPDVGEARQLSDEIKGFFADAADNPCTCNHDELNCLHCNAWAKAAVQAHETILAAIELGERREREATVGWLWKRSDDLNHEPRPEFADHAQFEAGRASEVGHLRVCIGRGDHRGDTK